MSAMCSIGHHQIREARWQASQVVEYLLERAKNALEGLYPEKRYGRSPDITESNEVENIVFGGSLLWKRKVAQRGCETAPHIVCPRILLGHFYKAS